MSEDATKKPKIIVDDDWKSRVQAEKEDLRKEQSQEGKADAGAASGVDDRAGANLPPASFTLLVTTLYTQAMAALGRIPDPLEGKLVARLPLAKHHIDTLGILEEKTKGNLTRDEDTLLASVLHQLRMDYLAGGYKPPAQPATHEGSSNAGDEKKNMPDE